MWIITCTNEYSGEEGKVEGLFHDKAVADQVCEHLNACAEAGQGVGDDELAEGYNNLRELFYGTYRVKEISASKTVTDWMQTWWGRNFLEKINDHQTKIALACLANLCPQCGATLQRTFLTSPDEEGDEAVCCIHCNWPPWSPKERK